jgi:hypothetical protein
LCGYTNGIRICGNATEETEAFDPPLIVNGEPDVKQPDATERCQIVNDINPVSNAGLGWSLNFGNIFRPRDDVRIYEPWQTEKLYEVYQGPDGSEHQFYGKPHESDPEDSPDIFYTRDGSYLRMWKNPSPYNGYSYRIEFPNGEKHFFQRVRIRNETRDAGGRLIYQSYDEDKVVRIEDQFGNYVNFEYQDDASDTDDNDGPGPILSYPTTAWLLPIA